MLFSVDAHAIGRRLTGNEVYVRSLLSAFDAVDKDSDFIAYLSTPEAAGVVPSRFRTRCVSRNPFIRLGYDLSSRVRKDGADLLHVQYTAPLGCPVPIVLTIHDVSFIEHPEYFTKARALQLRLTVQRTVEHAAKVITGSEFSRNAIARAYAVDPGRITVVPNAASPAFRPVNRDAAISFVRRKFGIPGPYILNVGDLQPRKNQAGLVRAFSGMLRAKPGLPHRLVLAGQESYNAAAVRDTARRSGYSERIHFTGFVSDNDLLQLYNACEFFVFPSLYEGFGLPVLEAMACARAVACSNSTAVPEVADAAALLFDPKSENEIIRAMLDLALEPGLRARMERLGSHRAAHFNWRRTAERTLDVYLDVVVNGAKRKPVARAAASA